VWGLSEIWRAEKKKRDMRRDEAQEKKDEWGPNQHKIPKSPIARLLGYDNWWLKDGDRLRVTFPSV
jgi:hypothetical protein